MLGLVSEPATSSSSLAIEASTPRSAARISGLRLAVSNSRRCTSQIRLSAIRRSHAKKLSCPRSTKPVDTVQGVQVDLLQHVLRLQPLPQVLAQLRPHGIEQTLRVGLEQLVKRGLIPGLGLGDQGLGVVQLGMFHYRSPTPQAGSPTGRHAEKRCSGSVYAVYSGWMNGEPSGESAAGPW